MKHRVVIMSLTGCLVSNVFSAPPPPQGYSTTYWAEQLAKGDDAYADALWDQFNQYADSGIGSNSLALRSVAYEIIQVGKKNGNRLAALVCKRLSGERIPLARGECMRVLAGIGPNCDAATRATIADCMLACFESAEETERNKSSALEYLVSAGDRRALPIIYKMLEGDEKAKLFALSRLPNLNDPTCIGHVLPVFDSNYQGGSRVLAIAALKCLTEVKNGQAIAPLLTILQKNYRLPICSNELVATLDALQPKVGSQTYQSILASDAAEARRQQELAAARSRAEQEARDREEQARQDEEKRKLAEIAACRKASADWVRADQGQQYEAFCRYFSKHVAEEIFVANLKTSFPSLKRTPDDILNPVLATLTLSFDNEVMYGGRSTGQVYFKFKYTQSKDGWEIAETKLNDEQGLAVAAGSKLQGICADVSVEVGREYLDKVKSR